MLRRIIILGSTGSIGTQALEVVAWLNEAFERGASPVRFEVVALAAGRNARVLSEQAEKFGVRRIAMANGEAESLAAGRETKVYRGPSAAEQLVRETPCDMVLGAMVGAAGLPATLAALELGRDVALANKETLVAAGELVTAVAARTGARLLPVDSEHSAIWQCLHACRSPGAESGRGFMPPMRCQEDVARITLTASGGPFRTWTRERIEDATPEQAMKHPTWNMGPKVTVDSASLTNKGLEVIEAAWLFGVPAERIDVLIHPQSIVHSFVEFADASVLAQLGAPDMRTPIQYALAYPFRTAGPSKRLDFRGLSRLDFEEPDFERFPALKLAFGVLRRGGTAGAVFNAANEEAVQSFLEPGSTMRFGTIARLTAAAVEHIGVKPIRTLTDVMDADGAAREFVRSRV